MSRTQITFDCTTGEITESALPEPTLAELKVAKLASIDQHRDSSFEGGFTVSGTGTALDGKVLQVRGLDDRTNWLTSQAAYAAAIAGGFGAAMGATFRTADNATITVTFSQGHGILLAMADWGKTVMNNSWTLKDACAAATTQAELDAIDIETGWPV